MSGQSNQHIVGMCFKINQMFGTKNSKTNHCKRPSCAKQMSRIQNIRTEICN